jgi:hypothetical protein
MKRLIGLSLLLCSFSVGAGVVLAQEGVMAPPKVLVIEREFLKPGKAGSAHAKTESAFVQAMTAAKWPTHYLAMDSLSGPSRSLFFLGYPSFEGWEADNRAGEKNATLSAAMDRAALADGELLTQYEQSVWVFNPDDSLGTDVNIGTMRYFEISQFKVKAGHQKDWNDLVKMYKDGYAKAVPGARWAMFESMYGYENGGLYLVLTPMKSLSETDHSMGDSKKFMDALGETGMKRLAELTAACIESSQTNLFQFNPKISYPRDEWVKADPTFWKPKPAVAAKKPEGAQ